MIPNTGMRLPDGRRATLTRGVRLRVMYLLLDANQAMARESAEP
jgi:hypothetical protein